VLAPVGKLDPLEVSIIELSPIFLLALTTPKSTSSKLGL